MKQTNSDSNFLTLKVRSMSTPDSQTQQQILIEIQNLQKFDRQPTVEQLLKRHDCLLKLVLQVSEWSDEDINIRRLFVLIIVTYYNYDEYCNDAGVEKSIIEGFKQKRRLAIFHLHPPPMYLH